MKNIILLDVDNCIAEDASRLHLIDKNEDDNFKRFKKYHDASVYSVAHNHTPFQKRDGIVIVTARPVEYQRLTLDWLNGNDIYPSEAYFRPTDDFRGSVAIKREVAKHIMRRFPNACIEGIDDRDDIVEMYTRLGIKARKLAIHDHSELRLDGDAR